MPNCQIGGLVKLTSRLSPCAFLPRKTIDIVFLARDGDNCPQSACCIPEQSYRACFKGHGPQEMISVSVLEEPPAEFAFWPWETDRIQSPLSDPSPDPFEQPKGLNHFPGRKAGTAPEFPRGLRTTPFGRNRWFCSPRGQPLRTCFGFRWKHQLTDLVIHWV